MAGDAPVYHAAEGSRKEEKAEGGSTAHMIYTHLMSGVSHMLPFVIGGGIMTAIAFLIDTLMGYGATGGSAFGSCTPLSAFFKYAGGLAMGLMVPVLAGYIAYSIADRPGLAVGFTGGLLASSGNALITGYNWADSTTGFQKFIADFAFQGANGGNTVSGFLGGILAGFLAGFIVLFLKKAFSKLPASLDGIKPTLIYPLLGILIISILMCFIFNPLIGLINTGLSNGLTAISDAGYITVLGLILGAMMAIDMGGQSTKPLMYLVPAYWQLQARCLKKAHSQVIRRFRHATLPWLQSWLVVWFLQSESHLPASSSRRNSQRKNVDQRYPTSLWVLPLLPRVPSHLQQQIRCT